MLKFSGNPRERMSQKVLERLTVAGFTDKNGVSFNGGSLNGIIRLIIARGVWIRRLEVLEGVSPDEFQPRAACSGSLMACFGNWQ